MKTGKREYNLIGTSEDPIPENEPCFILRGQDELAHISVRMYAVLAEARGLWAVARSARAAAEEMEKWPKKKRPDL